ncbi:MAG: SDR family NAD(P)-dependent oxidoreductase [Acidobacteria bacterium]|nr:SDR family NAD(P)-dependent oxidoreductase [Acidobacteriota bacterium]
MIFCLLTGATRGIGRAIALELENCFGKNLCALLISRNAEKLQFVGNRLSGDVRLLAADLSMPGPAGRKTASLLSDLNPADFEQLILINNAGVLPPVGETGTLNMEELEENIRINLTAPLILSDVFLHWAGTAPRQKLIINISSGAGRFPIVSWGAYCASKAGLDMFSRVMAKEEHPGLQVISVAPGIVETDMQKKIRGFSSTQFPLVADFTAYHNSGTLKSPRQAAAEIMEIIKHPQTFETITSL